MDQEGSPRARGVISPRSGSPRKGSPRASSPRSSPRVRVDEGKGSAESSPTVLRRSRTRTEEEAKVNNRGQVVTPPGQGAKGEAIPTVEATTTKPAVEPPTDPKGGVPEATPSVAGGDKPAVQPAQPPRMVRKLTSEGVRSTSPAPLVSPTGDPAAQLQQLRRTSVGGGQPPPKWEGLEGVKLEDRIKGLSASFALTSRTCHPCPPPLHTFPCR
jgi:hypothetical protein